MKKVLLCVWLERLSINSKPKVLVSACLLGKRVRYDAQVKSYSLDKLDKYELIYCCPEVDGGLSIPRPPSEIQSNGLLINSLGIDVSKEFHNGAKIALDLAKQHNIKFAVLKSKSPSCSNKMVYDGSFFGILKEGKGITVQLLEKNGIKVFDELDDF